MVRRTDIFPRTKSEIKTPLQYTYHSQRKISHNVGVCMYAVNKIKLNLDKKLPLSSKGKCKFDKKMVSYTQNTQEN